MLWLGELQGFRRQSRGAAVLCPSARDLTAGTRRRENRAASAGIGMSSLPEIGSRTKPQLALGLV